MRDDTVVKAAVVFWVFIIVAQVAVYATVAYVIYHFVSKLW
jgi:hypothetical protein